MSGNHALGDDELLAILGEAIRQADPVPQDVTDFALAIRTWPLFDSEVAALIFDSVEEEPVASRSVGSVRMFTFESTSHVISVEYDREASLILGEVTPVSEYTIDVVQYGTEVSTRTDDKGRFEVEVAGTGPITLVLRLDSVPILRTEWVLIT